MDDGHIKSEEGENRRVVRCCSTLILILPARSMMPSA